ncbi:hypothetical protein LY40_001346, partial [Prauserella salsuginis]|nr:hypothetical protein [Prauserella salsuginis]
MFDSLARSYRRPHSRLVRSAELDRRPPDLLPRPWSRSVRSCSPV